MRKASLKAIELPDFGTPTTEPVLGREVYASRLKRLEAKLASHKLDAVVIYGDREHSANIAWATGFDPRFEEAICIIVPGRAPALLLGNECYAYAAAAQGIFEPVLWQPLSLMGQPRDKYRRLDAILKECGVKSGMRISLAGWKGFETEEGQFDPQWFETPAYIVDALQRIGHVENAALLFMSPTDGLRAINEVEQLACFEYSATLTSTAIKRLVLGIRTGMTEYEAASLLNENGHPRSMHPILCSGPRAAYGLASPSMRKIENGDPIAAAFGLSGALNCRAGFMVENELQLPAAISDYLDKLVKPYFKASVAWYETIGIGVEGGTIFNAVMSHVGHSFFGVGLNPGHLIHLDEWVHSPIKKGSRMKIASGMAMQCDIIPATGTPYFASNIEDGIALADAPMRAEFETKFPEAWARIEARRTFMTEKLGIRLKPEVLPFSNIPAWLAPFWLSPGNVMTML